MIGYVPQKIQLDPDMPVRARDLVGLGLDGQRLGLPLPSAGRRARIDEMLHAVGAAQFGDARVGNLSGGEQQRVLIAHALISRPELLLLDEPLANLDIASEQEVVALLGRIAREQQIAVLISAHDMNPLLPVMDRIIYLAAGRAASGTTEEVVRTEVLSALYGQHVDVIRVHDRDPGRGRAGRGRASAAGPGHPPRRPGGHRPSHSAGGRGPAPTGSGGGTRTGHDGRRGHHDGPGRVTRCRTCCGSSSSRASSPANRCRSR